MLPTKDEIEQILIEHIDDEVWCGEFHLESRITGISEAADAIAALLTPAHRMSEFVTPHSLRGYNVPDPSGRHNVWIEECTICWDSKNRRCYDSDKGGDPCRHVQAVELWKARQKRREARERIAKMSESVSQIDSYIHDVTDAGVVYRVLMTPKETMCSRLENALPVCYNSDLADDPCDHVLAVELRKARQEAT